MNFLVDMPVSPQLARWLNENGHNAVHVGLHNAKDKQIIDEANKQHRIVITADLDFPQLLSIRIRM
ncbi:MAG: hypothetical protein A2Z46_07850 [Nitrospirae bacterium RBG_19FT_COMBO_55_12]|nr:MAG: hypothetical protein A2Z46_07850 [Nitrospirae bacterium RBG_19FT_COMBO_55_12]